MKSGHRSKEASNSSLIAYWKHNDIACYDEDHCFSNFNNTGSTHINCLPVYKIVLWNILQNKTADPDPNTNPLQYNTIIHSRHNSLDNSKLLWIMFMPLGACLYHQLSEKGDAFSVWEREEEGGVDYPLTWDLSNAAERAPHLTWRFPQCHQDAGKFCDQSPMNFYWINFLLNYIYQKPPAIIP